MRTSAIRLAIGGCCAGILTHVPCREGELVLDAADGTGHLGRAYAREGARAVVADLTPEMIAVGKREADAEGLRMLFVSADAAELPFPAGSFDLVVSRFAVHHFQDPGRQISEMVRVCRPEGRVGIMDLVAADPQLATELDRLERLRDPSHARALPVDELRGLLQEAGLKITDETDHDQLVAVKRWLSQSQTPDDVAEGIRRELHAELDGASETGLRPRLHDGELHLTQRWVIFHGRKG